MGDMSLRISTDEPAHENTVTYWGKTLALKSVPVKSQPNYHASKETAVNEFPHIFVVREGLDNF